MNRKSISSCFADGKKTLKLITGIILLILSFVLITWFVYRYMPVNVAFVSDGAPSFGSDWRGSFYRAALNLFLGKSPYLIHSFYNPPWILFPLIPLIFLPVPLGIAIMFTLNIFSYSFTAYKLKMNPVLILPLILFSGISNCAANGNIDGLISLGFVLPPSIGLFFVLAKPQIGIAVALFWLVMAWKQGGIVKVIKVFAPVTIAFIISISIYGPWFITANRVREEAWNVSLFPVGIAIGVCLLVLGLWKKEVKFAIAASPFLSPYLTGHSWAIVTLGLASLFPRKFSSTVENKLDDNNTIKNI